MRLAIALVSSLLLASCAHLGPLSRKSDYHGKGFALIAFRNLPPKYQVQLILGRDTANLDTTAYFGNSHSMEPLTISGNDSVSETVFVLPKGQWFIQGVRMWWHHNCRVLHTYAAKPDSQWKVDVIPGQALYLGQWSFVQDDSLRLPGATDSLPTTAKNFRILVQDSNSIDLALAKRVFPGLGMDSAYTLFPPGVDTLVLQGNLRSRVDTVSCSNFSAADIQYRPQMLYVPIPTINQRF